MDIVTQSMCQLCSCISLFSRSLHASFIEKLRLNPSLLWSIWSTAYVKFELWASGSLAKLDYKCPFFVQTVYKDHCATDAISRGKCYTAVFSYSLQLLWCIHHFPLHKPLAVLGLLNTFINLFSLWRIFFFFPEVWSCCVCCSVLASL